MLKSYLNSNPAPKFILFEDTVENKGRNFLTYICNNINSNQLSTVFCVTERDHVLKKENATGKMHVEDFTKWQDSKDLKTFVANIPADSVVIINSLAHFVFRYGFTNVYQTLSDLIHTNSVKQLIALLHLDLFLDDSVRKCFECLSTLHVELQCDHRVSFVYRKSARKIHKDIETIHWLEDGHFTSGKVQIAPISSVPMATIDPATISTFRIGLNLTEKQSRDGLVLPYLPKESGDIQYTFDDVDDWDEEDPDDDLDI